MRARYLNYFLNHVLTLQDDFATYYVQDPHSSDIPAPGIALKGLRGERQAAGWLQECVGPYNIGIDNMRSFLSDFAPYHYPLYQMDDHQIIDETAKIIMEYGYPIVVKPVFEPPGLQSDFLDHIFEAKNGTLQHTAEIQKLFETKKNPSQKRPEAGQQRKGFQFKSLMRGHHIEAPLDGDAISNVLNLPSAISADIANDVIDFTNAVLAEAQAMQDKGGLEYLKGAAKIQWHANVDWLRHIEEIARKGPTQLMAYLTGDFGKNVEETVRTGPSRLLGYVTGSDMWSDLGKSLSAENWKNAFKLGFYSATFGRLGFKGKASGIRSGAGSGTRTTNTANARQKIKPNTTNALKPTKIDTVKKDAFELDRKNVPKTTTKKQTGARELEYWDFDGAEKSYDAIRASKGDVSNISKNTGMKEFQVERIKDHLFNKKHQLDDGVRRFDADPQIANAWKRLEGGNYTDKDIQLLKHELFESKFEGIFKVDYRTAHGAANRAGRLSGLE
jgi:hypothetical protein